MSDSVRCVTCLHSDPHTGAGIGVCTSTDCGCDGPTTEANRISWINDIQRPAPPKPKAHIQANSLHRVIMNRKWTDREPDTFTVSVETAATDGEAYIVVSGNATWLNIGQASQVVDYLRQCIVEAGLLNRHDHGNRCCRQHETHSNPHKGCILR